jgi:tryptophan-rich sensory protein
MKLAVNIFIFLLLNFAALAIGALYTGDGVASDWYYMLNKAPWTPPGWVFGLAWTAIMVCYTFYMAVLYKKNESRKKIIILYAVQLLLNVAWNPLFFYFQNRSQSFAYFIFFPAHILLLEQSFPYDIHEYLSACKLF